ncbi:MAG: low temperature requirement protein A [Thermoleophilia bacterium]|nr:low temperature requirement protein A [Thermoleophilia bacterium]
MNRFARDRGQEQRATTLELFFDLVFVFAITQVSHLLLEDLSWRGAARAALVLLVVWWGWNYTTWVTNQLDPESTVVRLVLIGVMVAALLMAVAIPEAFGDRALLFAGAYVAMQVGRNGFLAAVAPSPASSGVLIWLAGAGVLWLAGAFAEGDLRTTLWIVALALDYGAPLVLYRVPGVVRLSHHSWQVETAHFAERFQLFMIIAFGETIVLTGATAAREGLDATGMAALGVAFLSTAAMWWLYFDYVARIAQRRLELAPDRVRLARDGYTYLHVVFVAGIILAAVGDELSIAHPTERLSGGGLAALAGGPALYLLGHALFRLRLAGSLGRRRLAGAAACGAAGLVGLVAPAIVVASLVVVVLVAIIALDELAAWGRRRRGEPSPLERLEASAGGTTLGA